MKQEDKNLLVKDLCARLPYGVMVREGTVLYDDKNTTSYRVKKLSYVHIGKCFSRIKGFIHDYEYIYIPYLFPLSSMTEEQEEEFKNLYYRYHESAFFFNERFSYDRYSIKDIGFYPCYLQDWLNKNHFDYRGLIEKGLAIDATELNIY